MRLLLLSVFSLFFSAVLSAQVQIRGTDNAAALSLGGATIALPKPSAGIQNEALLPVSGKMAFFVASALPFGIGDYQSAQAQAAFKLDKNSGVGLEFAYSGIELYREQRIRLGYGRRLGERVSLGGNLDWLQANALEYGNKNALTFGLSMLAQALPTLSIGAKIQNPLQTKLGESKLPAQFRLGACWKPGEQFAFSSEVEKIIDRPAQIKAGMEYLPTDILVLRAGVRGGGIGRAGFGVGLRFKNGLGLDFGTEWDPYLGFTPAAMIRWRKE
jgi:hypothetical protein